MNAVLALRGIRVQNANAVGGLTYGFPAMSGFLGFVEALDRRLRVDSDSGRLFDGCAVVCHAHRTLTDSHYGIHQFCLARRPVQPDGRTAPFVEEGRMHMTVTLLVPVRESLDDFIDDARADERSGALEDAEWFERRVADIVPTLRLAGGTILDVRAAEYQQLAADPEAARRDQRKLLVRSLPGFALVDRSELLPLHLEALRRHDPTISVLEAWMDFGALRHRAALPDDEGHADWERVTLPETGWFVPSMTGYRAIAPLQEAGTVTGARDPNVPFAPVESIYGVCQWLSPHRAPDLSSLVWRYAYDDDGRYSFVNRFIPEPAVQEEDA